MEIIIDGFDFWNFDAMKYYSFTSAFKGNKREKAIELCKSERYLGSRKMDGTWNCLIKDMDGKFHLRSRTKNVGGGYADKHEWIPQITNELKNIPNGSVILGEIYFPNDEGSRKVTSVFNCLLDKSLQRQEEKPLHFYSFDVIAWNGKSLINTPFEERIKFLNDIPSVEYVKIAEYISGEALWDLFIETLESGGEGIVIQRKDCKYLCNKRTAWMTLKMKKELEETIDAFIDGDYKPAKIEYDGKEIVNWPYWENIKTGEKVDKNKYIEYSQGAPWMPITKGHYHGWAGSISFSVMRDGEPFHIGWISGVTDLLKEEIITNPDKWIGKVVELTAMQIDHIEDNYTFRHGKIEKWRDDKKPKDCDYTQFTG